MANHDAVAHNWAHKTGRATHGFNMFYEGDTIYSYGHHFPIARHVTLPDGRAAIMFTTRGYSTSTSKHLNYTSRAIPGDALVIHCKNPEAESKAQHKENYAAMLEDMRADIDKATRARSRKGEYLRGAEYHRTQANDYTRIFKLGFRQIAQPADYAALLDEHRAAEERRKAAQAAKDRRAIRKWLNGADVHPPHTAAPYVRVYGDELQTSWGIRVPLPRALACFRLAKKCRDNAREYVPAKVQRIGQWTLDRIASDGTVRAGCHVIPWRMQAEAAKLAGLA